MTIQIQYQFQQSYTDPLTARWTHSVRTTTSRKLASKLGWWIFYRVLLIAINNWTSKTFPKYSFIYFIRPESRVANPWNTEQVKCGAGTIHFLTCICSLIHVRTVVMDLHFVEPGKNAASLTQVKWPACCTQQSKHWCNKWAFLAAVNALSTGKSLR